MDVDPGSGVVQNRTKSQNETLGRGINHDRTCHGTVQTAGTQVLGASGGQPEGRAVQRGNVRVPGTAGNRTDGRADSRPGERPGKGTGGQPAAEQPGRETDR